MDSNADQQRLEAAAAPGQLTAGGRHACSSLSVLAQIVMLIPVSCHAEILNQQEGPHP
jgi:hypothetical protein